MKTTEKSSPLAAVVAWEEFVEATGIGQEQLQELLSLGWLESRKGEDARPFFRDADIYRVRKLERICSDFDLPVLGGTIIVDLLERIDELERMVRSLQGIDES